MSEETSRMALFVNFTDKPFIHYWNGKPHEFKPGEQRHMPEYLARHFAKHLANRELISMGKETATSPKKPEENEAYLKEFNKACIVNDTEPEKDMTDVQTDIANQPKQSKKVKTVVDNKPPQIIHSPDDEEFEDVKK